MKRIKFILICTAIIIAFAGSFASTKNQTCQFYPQFKLVNGTFQPAGQEGVDYFCWDVSGVCTYYKTGIGGPYLPCKTGSYIPLH